MKYNLSNIMKKAHEIKKQDKRNIWSECLKMAWNAAKESSFIAYALEKYEEFLPTRKQIGVIYRNWKLGTVSLSEKRINDIYDELEEFEQNKMNYGFSYAKSNAGGLLFISRAIAAIFEGDFKSAEIILN